MSSREKPGHQVTAQSHGYGFCRQCGTITDSRALKCPQCGSRDIILQYLCDECGMILNMEQPQCPRCGKQNPIAPEPVYAAPVYTYKTGDQKRKLGKKILIVTCSFLALAAIVTALVMIHDAQKKRVEAFCTKADEFAELVYESNEKLYLVGLSIGKFWYYGVVEGEDIDGVRYDTFEQALDAAMLESQSYIEIIESNKVQIDLLYGQLTSEAGGEDWRTRYIKEQAPAFYQAYRDHLEFVLNPGGDAQIFREVNENSFKSVRTAGESFCGMIGSERRAYGIDPD